MRCGVETSKGTTRCAAAAEAAVLAAEAAAMCRCISCFPRIANTTIAAAAIAWWAVEAAEAAAAVPTAGTHWQQQWQQQTFKKN